MAITEWHTPIHECQKGEVQREWCYLEPYYFFTGDLKRYSKLLKYAFLVSYFFSHLKSILIKMFYTLQTILKASIIKTSLEKSPAFFKKDYFCRSIPLSK